jgi:hypothetical protein
LVQDALAAYELEIEAAQQPDPSRLAHLKSELERIDRAIEFTRRTVGDTPKEQADAERLVRGFSFSGPVQGRRPRA